MKTVIDLCCGLGKWDNADVIGIDSNPKVRPTIIADVQYLPLRPGLKPDHVHASPPCRFLSWARVRRQGYDELGVAESLRIVAACFEAFRYLQPKTWTLENPRGVLRRLVPPTASTEYSTHRMPHKKTDFWSNVDSLKKAIIPQEIRQKILSLSDPGVADPGTSLEEKTKIIMAQKDLISV